MCVCVVYGTLSLDRYISVLILFQSSDRAAIPPRMKNVWEEARNRMNGPKTSQLHPAIQWRADAGEIKGKEGDDDGVKMVSRARHGKCPRL